MKKAQWSEYEKFIILLDKYNRPGCNRGFQAYQDYRIVINVLNDVVKGKSPDSYIYEDRIVDLGVTKSIVMKIIDKIDRGQWSEEIRSVAIRLKLENLVVPFNGEWVIPVDSSIS